MLWRIPISTPVKLARSTTKLFKRADQPLKAIGVATDIKISINIGESWEKIFFMKKLLLKKLTNL